MTPQNAITWLRLEQFNQWMLFRGQEKVAAYDGKEESIDEGVTRFTESIALQKPGSFTLKGYKGHSKQAAAMTFEFDVKSENQSINQRGNMNSNLDTKSLFEQAEQAAYQRFTVDQWKKDIETRVSALELALAELAKAGKDLADDDDDNDDDAMDKITEMAGKLPGLVEGFKSLTGFTKA